MQSFQQISALFEQHLNEALPFPKEQESLYEPCRYLLSAGGKRVRPSLCLMAAELFGEIDSNSYLAAMAIELFHNFTLIHDDIMDKSSLRRGKPTVHVKYGLTSGILSGDVMGIFAYNCLGQINSDRLPRILRIFNKMAIEVCEGQQWDMDFETRNDVRIEEYLKMIELKTSVLLAASLQIGALLAGASEEDAQHLSEFGKYMGIAFQLQDDYLDTFGNEQEMGKKAGGDIAANKKTFLMLKTKEMVSEEEVFLMERQDAGMDAAEKIERVKQLYLKFNIDGHSRSIINHYSNISFEYLDKINAPAEKKQAMHQLASWLLQRQY